MKKATFPSENPEEIRKLYETLMRDYFSRMVNSVRSFRFDDDLANEAVMRGFARYVRTAVRHASLGDWSLFHHVEDFRPHLVNCAYHAALDIRRRERRWNASEPIDEVSRKRRESCEGQRPSSFHHAAQCRMKIPAFLDQLESTEESETFRKIRAMAGDAASDETVFLFGDDFLFGPGSRRIDLQLGWHSQKTGNAREKEVSRRRQKLRDIWNRVKGEIFGDEDGLEAGTPTGGSGKGPSPVNSASARSDEPPKDHALVHPAFLLLAS